MERYNIAGYCRISVDEEMDRENTSIENQKAIIEDFVHHKFPDSTLVFYEDRDRSGYTFEQREGYQQMRKKLMSHEFDILIVKDFSRFSRRNSKGLVELEDLRDAGIRIIAIGDGIDYPTYDDWTAIQFRFLINEMPVTDTSKKVKTVINKRQSEGKWICSVPYGYVLTNTKKMTFEVDEPAAEVVRTIFKLYNQGYGYKKIANHLTDQHIPTPRMYEKMRKEAMGEEYKVKAKDQWSIVTISEILRNDFYIGTLRQGKYYRKKINGSDVKADESDHIVFENHHEPIIDYRTFAITQELLKKRTNSHYRGVKKYDNVYSGFLFCGDCGSPMFPMSRKDLAPAYRCGTYHTRGVKGCTSHHTRVDVLDNLMKSYIRKVKDNSVSMIQILNESLRNEQQAVKENTNTLDMLKNQIEDCKAEIKMLARQKARDIMKNPEKEDILSETYDEMINELANRIEGLQNQYELTANRRNTIVKVNRIAKTALDIFDDILNKDKLEKTDLEFILEKITVYEDRVEIVLKSDIDTILSLNSMENIDGLQFESDKREGIIVQKSRNHLDKILSVNVISEGDPLEIFTDNDGEVVFKKYSPVGEMSPFTATYADVLSRACGMPVLICDRDHVVAVAGVSRKEFMEKRISSQLEEIIEQRRTKVAVAGESKRIAPVEGVDRYVGVVSPIITSGDVVGAVCLLLPESGAVPTEGDVKLAQVAAAFLGKQMEE